MSMRLRLFHALRLRAPRLFDRIVIRTLMRVTARAFGERLGTFGSNADNLQAYAQFTSRMALRVMCERDDDGAIDLSSDGSSEKRDIARRLREDMRDTARTLRRVLGVRNDEEAWEVVHTLYGAIGIEMDAKGRPEGGYCVCMHRCYFSGAYGPAVCAFMSSMDEGLMAGLVGEGSLAFSSRITQGADACQACFCQIGDVR